MHCVHYLSAIRLEDGGVVRAVLDLCGAIAAAGHEVTLLTCDACDIPATWHDNNQFRPRVVELPHRGPGGRLGRQSRVEAAQQISQAQLLHLHTPWDLANLQFAQMARQRGLPYIVSPHGMLDEWSMAQRPWKKRLHLAVGGRRMLEQAAAVHFTAMGECQQSSSWCGRAQRCVLPLAFDLEPYRELPGGELAEQRFPSAALREPDCPVVLFLSRLHYKKGIEHLIEAVADLLRAGQPTKLLIAGRGSPGYEAKVKRLIGQKGLGEHVVLLGQVTGRDKVSLLQRADLFVLPTSQENFGFVFLEAMAAGTAVVTTRGVDIWPELKQAGGWIIDLDQPMALTESLKSLLANHEERVRRGQQGRDWVFQQFEPQRLMRDYGRLYQALAAGERLPADLAGSQDLEHG
jgi:glycosyltransferase involved in cell wall biosynthesis